MIFAAYGKVFLVRKIRGPDRGHLYAMKVSIAEEQHLSGSVVHLPFPAGVEEGKHCAEEEDHRAHKDGAAGILL